MIEGITDKGYITNSYHVHVTEHINAFDKKAVAPRPIIALPTSLSLKEISKQELLNIISKTLCKDKEDILKSAQAENEAER